MNKSLTWASTLLHSLFEHGTRHAIISPGSRSTPLTLAASIHPGLSKRVVLDERSAAFIALGIGKSTGLPAILICTSGTAASNYYPAVIEAKESGVPLVILSADRPPNLRNLGSAQTIDQLKMFGSQAVFFHEAGEPVDDGKDFKRIAYLGKQAVEYSLNRGGAAHLNLPFRKPLEPDADFLKKERERLLELAENGIIQKSENISEIKPDTRITDLISNSAHPLMIAGPANPAHALTKQIEYLSNKLKAPVLAEPGSQAGDVTYSISHFDLFIRDDQTRSTLKPDLILRFGDQPYSSSLLWAMESWKDVPVVHITARERVQDHAMTVIHSIKCRKNDSIRLENIESKTDNEWLKEWQIQQNIAQQKLQERLYQTEQLTDGHVFHYVSDQLSDEWNVMLSNSLPVRDMLTFSSSQKNQFVNRGAAGIDGILSTALGIYFSSNRPTCCLIGDLAFLHDSNALLTLQRVKEKPFIAVVVNNQGGNIFQMLPVYRNSTRAVPLDIYDQFFETPQSIDIAHLAKAAGIRYHKVETLSDLHQTDLHQIGEACIIECVTDKKASMDLRIDLVKS